jgi:serine/threonine-protein kinase
VRAQTDDFWGERVVVGQPIGSRYELGIQLGRGAFGSVWRGTVRDTGEAVAIKVLLEELAADADVVTRFLRERTAMVNLRHRSLVSIRDLVVEGDVLALVLQLVEGPDLRAYLRGRGTLAPVEAALLVADVAEALAVAHAAQIIHRDVKPANVLLQPEDGGFRPLLTDFGIARLADAPSVTRTSQVVGTPYYLAPEVISGRQATSAVDVYSAGIMLLELILGHPPFRGKDAMEVFEAHQSAAPVRPPGVDDRLWSVVSAALAKDPAARPSAAELAARLRIAVRTERDGTIAQLPINKAAGTVVLPALAGLMKQAAAEAPAWKSPTPQPSRAVELSPRPMAAARPELPTHTGLEPGPTVPLRQPGGYPAQPYYPPSRQTPQQRQQPQGYPQATRGAAPVSQPARPITPAQQPRVSQPQPQQQPPRAQQQSGSAQYGRTAPPHNQPPQNQPQHNQAPPPRRQASRYPREYATPAPPPQRSGLSCLSKLAILFIVLVVATVVGLAIGRNLARRHQDNTGQGLSLRSGAVSLVVSLERDQQRAAPAR